MQGYQFCQYVKVDNIPAEAENLYNQLQRDYRQYVNMLFRWLALKDGGFGYGKVVGNKKIYISPKENLEQLGLTGERRQAAKNFINSLFAKKDDVLYNITSIYSLFYSDYTWFKAEAHPGVQARNVFEVQCQRPKDYNYCRTLSTMIEGKIRSVFEHYKLSVERIQDLENTVCSSKKNLKNPDVYELLWRFSNELDSLNYGLSKYVLTTSLKNIIDGTNSNVLQLPMEVLAKKEYTKLVEFYKENKKGFHSLYNLYKNETKLNDWKSRPYPIFNEEHRDYQVPFGLTALIKYTIELNGKNLLFTVDGQNEKIVCRPSKYFSNLSIKPWFNKEKFSGYTFNFQHKYVSKNTYRLSDSIEGVVKEIRLQKREKGYYVYLPFSVNHSDDNHNIKLFFDTAKDEKSRIDIIPDKIRVGAIDLNIFNPVSCVKADITKNATKGSIEALDYGKGELCSPPKFLLENGKNTAPLREISRNCKEIISCIRAYKSSKKLNREFDVKTLTRLQEFTKLTSTSVRYLIQMAVKKVNSRLSEFKYNMRKEGYKNLGDCIALIDAMDNYHYLNGSYERIHLKPGEILPFKPFSSETSKRQKFRIHISRRIANAIAKEMKDCNVVFMENLSFKGDKDEMRNSLIKIFSAGILIEHIELALNKIGIEVVKVEQSGTSKTDPVTGLVGVRNQYDKGKLNVIRNNQLGYINADLAAAVNVLLQGLSHSVCRYKFFVGKSSEVVTSDDVKHQGKREKRFFDILFKTTKGKIFFYEENGLVTYSKVKLTKPCIKGELIYAHGKNLILERERKKFEEKIKDLLKKKEKEVKFDVTPSDTKSYDNFSLNKCLKMTQVVDTKQLTA